jgi:putative CocE/NonD family hydrolase
MPAVIVTEFPRAVREIEHTLIPLKDGTRLAARIWLPQDAEHDPVPALLEYLPYRKRDGTFERDALTHPYLAGHGYAGVRVDIRGSGESDGVLSDEYSQQELDDALEVIAWLAAQPWCSGQVGMFGISWGGFNALQVAALRPPALKAIVTLCSTDDRYADDVHYMGGAKLASADLGWGSFFFTDMCHPPDPALVGERWRDMWLQRLEAVPVFLERWLRHPTRDAYWQHGSVCEDYGAIACPVFAVGGWTDGYSNAVPRLLQNLRGPRKGLIGPWAHAYPHFAKPGPQIGFLQEMLRWWDHWLKGRDTSLMAEPMLRAWMTDSHVPATFHETLPGRWVGEPSWPPPGNRPRRLYLGEAGLTSRQEALVPRDIRSPADLGTQSGEWCPFGRGHDQADDQQPDDARSLCFDTPPLGETIELLGAPVVTLDVASNKPVAQVIARLCDVHPDGRSLRVSYGVLNLTHRGGHAHPEPLVPGQRYRVRLHLNDCGVVLPAGHRLRLALSTVYWPMVWPAPEEATVTVMDGTLDLPVRPLRLEDAALPSLPPPETAAPDGTDRQGLKATTKMHDEAGPAMIAMRWTETKRRGDWQVRIETSLRLSSTPRAFRLEATLQAHDGETEICRRTWDSSIERDSV